jgi:hypothetical protein
LVEEKTTDRKILAGAQQQRPNSKLLINVAVLAQRNKDRTAYWTIASDYNGEPKTDADRIYEGRENDLVVDLFSSFYATTTAIGPVLIAPPDQSWVVPARSQTTHLGTPWDEAVHGCVTAILAQPQGKRPAVDQVQAACREAGLSTLQHEQYIPTDMEAFFD